jgi:hypothetical protein
MKQILKSLALSMLVAGVFVFIQTSSAHAATLTVVSGIDETVANGGCSLSEAILSINAGNTTTYPECTGTGVFGTDDIIELPAGTITLSADVPAITESIHIEGQGMGVSVVNGAGTWAGLISSAGDFSLKGFTITAARNMAALSNGDGNVVYEQMEVDGSNWYVSDPSEIAAGLVAGGLASSDITVTVRDSYVHSFNVNASQLFPVGVVAGGSANTDAVIENVTIANNQNTGLLQSLVLGAGLFDGGVSTAQINSRVRNITITNNSSTASTVTGILLPVITGSTNESSLDIKNVTVTNLSAGGISPFLGGGSGAAIGVAAGGQDSAIANITIANALLANNNVPGCFTADIGSILGVTGVVTTTITSQGGNLSDDTTCSSFFTHPTDQNNLTTLSTTLEALSDNGGFVPTMALKQGSPAIDAGITIAGLTSDARGALRPQGAAFDSGAYESAFSKVAPASLASTGGDTWVILASSLGLIAVGAGYLIVKFGRGRL